MTLSSIKGKPWFAAKQDFAPERFTFFAISSAHSERSCLCLRVRAGARGAFSHCRFGSSVSSWCTLRTHTISAQRVRSSLALYLPVLDARIIILIARSGSLRHKPLRRFLPRILPLLITRSIASQLRFIWPDIWRALNPPRQRKNNRPLRFFQCNPLNHHCCK